MKVVMSAAEWVQDLPSLLNGELARAGFNYRLRFSSAHPLSLPCCLAYSLSLHHNVNYPTIQDFLNISWKPKVGKVVPCAEEAKRYGNSGDWWEGLGHTMLDVLQEQLGSDKSNLLDRVRSGIPITFDDAHVLAKVAELLFLTIVWIEDQADGPLTHVFAHSKKQDPSLFVYLLQSNRTLSLLYHPDFEQPTGSERFPYYMIVGGSVSPVVFGDVVGQNLGRDRADQAKEQFREAERRVIASAVALIRDWCPYGVPMEVSASLNQFSEETARYQQLSAVAEGPVTEVSSLLQVISQPSVSKKRLPIQHNLSNCRTSRMPGELKTLTCGHCFHTSCLRVYINLQVGEVPCPICPRYISEELLTIISPEYIQKALLQKSQTMVINSINNPLPPQLPADEQFHCVWCILPNRQRGTAHGCPVCMDCMHYYYFNGGKCGACGEQFTAEDIQLAEATLAK